MIKLYCIETATDIWMYEDHELFKADVLHLTKKISFLFEMFDYRVYTRLIDKKEWLAMPDEQHENDPA